MTKYFSILLFFVRSSATFAQSDILDGYPTSQFFYEKGELSFLKDLQDAALENGLQPCKDKEEHYAPKFIVFPDRTIKFIKDQDSVNIAKNKCAYDFSKNVLKYLEKWNPVVIKQVAYPAIASYDINPSNIFEMKINADLTPNFQPAEYRGGSTAFSIGVQKLIGPIFDKNHMTLNDQVITIKFKISKIGTIESVKIAEPVPFRIEDEILQAVQGLKKWKPASMNGVAVPQNVTLSLRFGD